MLFRRSTFLFFFFFFNDTATTEIYTLSLHDALPIYACSQKCHSAVLLPGSSVSAKPSDRKSTRLNSSHHRISYAVFCLKKKKTEKTGSGRGRARCTTARAPGSCAPRLASSAAWPGGAGAAPPVCLSLFPFFFFNDTATTEIYTLSLHDALPIWSRPRETARGPLAERRGDAAGAASRSEEHTSELQSPPDLVCRLLLEKKKKAVTKEANHDPPDASTKQQDSPTHN